MLIRNSDTGQMMELDLATGDMKPLSDGPPQTPTADTGSPGKAPDSPDDFVDSSPEKGGRKRPSFSESMSKMRFSRRAAEVAGVSRATKDVAFEASKVQLDVTLEKIKFLKAALKEQERAARAYYAAQAEVCARVKDLAAGTPLEAPVNDYEASATAARWEVETTLMPAMFGERLVAACGSWHAKLDRTLHTEVFKRQEATRRELDHYKTKLEPMRLEKEKRDLTRLREQKKLGKAAARTLGMAAQDPSAAGRAADESCLVA